MIHKKNSILITNLVVLTLGRCILRPFRGIFIFILVSVYMVVVVRVFTHTLLSIELIIQQSVDQVLGSWSGGRGVISSQSQRPIGLHFYVPRGPLDLIFKIQYISAKTRILSKSNLAPKRPQNAPPEG